MRVLSLFSGGGLGDFGLMAAGMEIAGQVEIDDYCQKILALRYPDSVKWKDIRSVTGAEVKEKCGSIDVISGGFPCQPFSNAGNKRGNKDDRYLWPEMLRVISEVRPTWVIGENVLGIVNMALDHVCTSLEEKSYSVQTFVFPAHALGAPHRRERVWIVAYSKCNGSLGTKKYKIVGEAISKEPKRKINSFDASGTSSVSTTKRALANTTNPRDKRMRGWEIDPFNTAWAIEPNVGRVADGVANRVHRLKLLGNGQVPACTAFIGKRIMRF